MKYYIIAGEASGDLHAANLIKEIKKRDPKAEFRAWGGDLVQAQGATLVKHYRDLDFMGFIEVVMNLKTILKNIQLCKQDLKAWQPEEVILVDYPGFNLKIAAYAKKLGIKVIYYISPQVWAWKSGRVHTIKKYVDQMLVILPFEQDFYKKYNYQTHFVGHPLLDAIAQKRPSELQDFKQRWGLDERRIIALLPGSRKQEIKVKLPIMLSVVKDFPEYQFVVAGAPSQARSLYEPYLNHNVKWVGNETYALLQHAHAALVTSGTATLETALLGVPEVVCYKGSRISYEIGKRLVKNIKYISLVNLIMNREVVKELIQQDLNEANLKRELTKILSGEAREQILADYKNLHTILGGQALRHEPLKS
ncbi:lipid-A-disaccharide synthase [Ornithobacterium rhinotracheale]|uniref:Lipid-A-disaccharide synthase n=1 Tax=Ornithobacterium rhinotracheale TaxID=28251 RepID=A0A3R5USR2_ORNRH|nr:lipid-A-disaccharide synthase [Ornithobacterium rhinotracheale]